MKELLHKTLRFLAVIALGLIALTAYAESTPLTFKVGKLWFQTTSDNTCQVIPTPEGEAAYVGAIDIPANASHEGKQYRVTAIADYAFISCDIDTIKLSNILNMIGEKAFTSCKKLREVTFPNTPMLSKIGKHAFSNSGVQKVIISQQTGNMPKSSFNWPNIFNECQELAEFEVKTGNQKWTSIDGVLFDKTKTKLVMCPQALTLTSYTIPTSCTEVCDSAFLDNQSIKTLVIPDNVTKLNSYCFSGMDNLVEVTIGDGITELPYRSFAYGFSKKNFGIVRGGQKIERICEGAFDLSRLKSIEFHEGLRSIGKEAFYLNWYLCEDESLILPSTLEEVGQRAFYNCLGFHTVEIPAKAKFGAEVFGNCGNLRTINFAEGFKEISYAMFLGCSSIYNISIPASVEEIGSKAFQQCWQLRKITVAEGNQHFTAKDNVLFTKDMKNLLVFPPQNMGVKKYEIPNGVERLATASFCMASELQEVVIPESVDSIGPLAFGRSTSLKKINIPSKVRTIGERTFDSCNNLTNISLSNGLEEIKEEAFNMCSNLTDFHFPPSLRIIGKKAFSNASKFENIEFSNSLENIGEKAFEQTYITGSLTIPASVTKWGSESFYYLSNIDTVTICSNSVVPDGAFAYSAIKAVKIGKGVPGISSGIFYNDSQIKRIEIEDGLKFMGDNNFGGCYTNITIPNSVESIGIHNFGSQELKTIDLGTGLKSTGYLTDSPKLDYLICRATEPPVVTESHSSLTPEYDNLVTPSLYGHTLLFVPEKSIDAYKAAPHWSRFLNIKSIEKDLAGVDTPMADNLTVTVNGNEINVTGYEGNISVTNLAGRTVYNGPATTVAVSESGLYIVRAADKTWKLLVK